MKFLIIFFVILFSSILLVSQNAFADEWIWTGTSPGVWNDGSNWNCTGGACLSSFPTVLSFDTEDSVLISGSSATVTINVDVNFGHSTFFEIKNGATVTNNAILTISPAGENPAVLDIAGATLINLDTVNNEGEIFIQESSETQVSSVFDNDGLLINSGSIFIDTSSQIENSDGTIDNTGEITNNGLLCGGTLDSTSSPTPNGHEPNCSSSNSPPTSANGVITTDEDTSYIFSQIDFPYDDPDSDPLHSITIVNPPTDGRLELSGTPVTGSQLIMAANIPNLMYFPLLNDNGSPADSFTFSVSDGSAQSSTHTMSIDVNPINDPPIARPIWFSVAENSVDNPLDVTLNDEDVDGTLLGGSVTVKFPPSHAASPPTVDSNNIVFYTPEVDFASTDTFGYTVKDNDGAESNVVLVEITVVPEGVTVGDGTTIGDGSTIDPNTDVGSETTIGDNTNVEKDSTIGDNVEVGSDVTVEKGTDIGDDTVIEDGVTIVKNTSVGNGTTIGAGTFIDKDVTIGDNVIIGTGVFIEKGVVIGDGTVIGDNVVIRKNTIIGSMVDIGNDSFIGSDVQIGDNEVIPPSSFIPNNSIIP